MQDLVGRKPNNVLDEERTGDSSFVLVAEVLPHDPLVTGNFNLEQLAKHPKVLPPGCMMSLFEVYAFQNGRCPDSQGCASKSTFKREFSLWKYPHISAHVQPCEVHSLWSVRGAPREGDLRGAEGQHLREPCPTHRGHLRRPGHGGLL